MGVGVSSAPWEKTIAATAVAMLFGHPKKSLTPEFQRIQLCGFVVSAYEAPNFTSVRGRAACHDRDRRLSSGVLGLARRHGCACSSADVWVLGLGGTLETAVGRLSAKHRPQPLRSGAPGPGGRRPLAAAMLPRTRRSTPQMGEAELMMSN